MRKRSVFRILTLVVREVAETQLHAGRIGRLRDMPF